MALKRTPLFWVRIAIVVVVLLWYWVAPRRTWNRFLVAVESASPPDLEATIDLPRLRGNLLRDLAAAVQNNPGRAPADSHATSNDLLNSLVDAASAPEGLQQTLAGFGYAGGISLVGPNAPAISFHYHSPLSLDVWMRAAGAPETETGLFTMQLSGSGWRITRIRSRWLAEKQG